MARFRLVASLVVLALLSLGAASAPPAGATSEPWVWQRPLPQGNDLLGLHFVDQNVGWAVGVGGAIVKTADGGSYWTRQSSSTVRNLMDVDAVDVNTAWAVGRHGTVVKTVDGGVTWTDMGWTEVSNIMAVDFVDAANGWMVTQPWANVWHTTDGGATWELDHSDSYTSQAFEAEDVQFLDESTGWVVGRRWDSSTDTRGVVLRTTSGGATWQKIVLPDKQLVAVSFVDANIGWAVGLYGVIVKTTDGGLTWTPQTSGTTHALRDVCFTSEQNGWAAGDEGTMLRTSDGGATWERLAGFGTSPIKAVGFGGPTEGCVVSVMGRIARTTDGGNWSWLEPPPSGFSGVDFADMDVGWAVGGQGTIYATRNGGANWELQVPDTTEYLTAVFAGDRNRAWAVGYHGIVLRTTDGGGTWVSSTAGYGGLQGVGFADSTTGWAVAQTGEIFKSVNGGKTWTKQDSGIQDALYAVAVVDVNTAYACGANGRVLKTTDGGAHWVKIGFGSTTFRGIHFSDASNGWLVGDTNIVFRTTDGAKWNTAAWFLDTPHLTLSSVCVDGQGRGWAVGRGFSLGDPDPCIVESTDGGQTWRVQPGFITTNYLAEVTSAGEGMAWIVGNGETILKTGFTRPSIGIWPLVEPARIMPLGMSLGPGGNLYVASWQDYVAEYTTAGSFVRRIGSYEDGVFGFRGLQNALDVAVGADRVYVLDPAGVAVYSPEGAPLGAITAADGIPFSLPAGVALDSSGNLFVCDQGDGVRVSKFSREGQWICSFGSGFEGPASAGRIAVGPDGRVYLGDWAGTKILVYEPANAEATAYQLAAVWRVQGLGSPDYLTVGPAGDLFVVDSLQPAVFKLSPLGVKRAAWGGSGTGAGEFTNPTGIAMRDDGHVFVVECDNPRIQEFVDPSTPAPTSLTISATPAVIDYAGQAKIGGRLISLGAAVRAATVQLQSSSNGSSWSDHGPPVTTSESGGFSFTVNPSSKTFYRVTFAGTIFLPAASSASATVTPRAMVGTPVAPEVMHTSQSSAVTGVLKPRHTQGTKAVRIYRWRKVGGLWRGYGYVSATVTNFSGYSKYVASVRLTTAGQWRLRAYHADSRHEASWSSGYRYVTVR